MSRDGDIYIAGYMPFLIIRAVLDEPRFSSLHYSHRQMDRPVPADAPPAFSSSIQLCNSVKYDASIRGQIMGESERECCFLSVEQIIFRRCLSHQ